MEDRITMAHGSGGRSSAELMREVFGRYFRNPILDRLEDAALLELSGRVAYSTDSFVVTPPEFPGGNIGKLAVCGTVNDLLVMGAEPRYLSTAFILEEGLELSLLERVVRSLAEEAAAAGVTVVTGDTKVVEGRGGLMINTSGIGLVPPGREVGVDRCRPGDRILLSGNLGDHHACILSARMEIENGVVSDCACLGELTRALWQGGVHVRAMRDVTRGGLGTVLNELSAGAGAGVCLWERALPVSAAVRGFCGLLGLDPLYMGNEGKLAAVVPAEEGEKALALMRATEQGKDAEIIGAFTDKHENVVMETLPGGLRVVDMLYGEGLPRIC
ncbi:MAG: hydrogenase expression/formation protein HypE [Bacillota bacterium]|nr:hydrogenase expression/formation protein HypE [Bacillota bacterium]